MLNRFKEFKHEWEREHLENSRNLIFKNTFSDIENILKIGNANGRALSSSAMTLVT